MAIGSATPLIAYTSAHVSPSDPLETPENTGVRKRRAENTHEWHADKRNKPGTSGQNTMRATLHQQWEQSPIPTLTTRSHFLFGKGIPKLEELERNCFSLLEGRKEIKFDDRMASALLRELKDFNLTLTHEPAPDQTGVQIPPDTTLKIGGENINAHYIYLRRSTDESISNHVGIAGSYPSPEDLNNYIAMLYKEMPSVVVVLAESQEVIEKNIVEYFKDAKGKKYNGIHFVSTPTFKALPRTTDGLKVQCYMSTLTNEEGHQVQVPFAHILNWGDGLAVTARHLAPVINLISAIQIRDDGRRTRVPMAHCRMGVGRTGHFFGAYLLARYSGIKNLADLIKDLRSCRSPSMAYADAQQTELGNIAAMRGIIVRNEQREINETDILGHIGYDIDVVPNKNFMTALRDADCLLRENQITSDEAETHLSQLSNLWGAVTLKVISKGKVLQEVLWNKSLEKGRNTENGDMFEGSPLAFWQEKIRDRISYDAIKTVSISPSAAAGDIALFIDESGEDIQNMFRKYVKKLLKEWEPGKDFSEREVSEFVSKTDLNDIRWFLETQDITVYQNSKEISIENLRSDSKPLIETLKNSKNIMLEFFDNEGKPIRYTFQNLNDESQNRIGLRYDGSSTISLSFESIQDIIDHIIGISGKEKFLGMLSTDPLVGMNSAGDFDSTANASDSDKVLAPVDWSAQGRIANAW